MRDPIHIAYMAAGGLAIYFGFQWFGICVIAVGKLARVW
jgi:hypothetical protein